MAALAACGLAGDGGDGADGSGGIYGGGDDDEGSGRQRTVTVSAASSGEDSVAEALLRVVAALLHLGDVQARVLFKKQMSCYIYDAPAR